MRWRSPGPSRRPPEAYLGDGDLAHAGHAPDRHGGIPVLADDVGVDVAGIDGELPAQQVAEAGGIQHRARTDHPGLGDAHALVGHLGEDVHRVADHDQDGVPVMGTQAVQDGLEDPHVGPGQVQPGLTRPPAPPGRHHHHVRVGRPLVALGADFHVFRKGEPVAQVIGLPQGLLLVGVDDADGLAAPLDEQGVGHRRPHVPGSDDGHFHRHAPGSGCRGPIRSFPSALL